MTSLSAEEATELFRRPPDRFIDVGGAGVGVRTVGTGPAVVFVHGWPVSGATFRLLLPHLVDHVTCHVLDLPGAGASRFDRNSELTVARHIASVRQVVDELDADRVALVGHDSGGLMARHAAVGHPKVRALGLIDTEQPQGLNLRFKAFLAGRHLPGFGRALGWVAGKPKLRRNGLVLGNAFADRSLLDGAFDELFLQPLHRSPSTSRPRCASCAASTSTWSTSSPTSTVASTCRCSWSGGSATRSSPWPGPGRWCRGSPTRASRWWPAPGCSRTRSDRPRWPPRCSPRSSGPEARPAYSVAMASSTLSLEAL